MTLQVLHSGWRLWGYGAKYNKPPPLLTTMNGAPRFTFDGSDLVFCDRFTGIALDLIHRRVNNVLIDFRAKLRTDTSLAIDVAGLIEQELMTMVACGVLYYAQVIQSWNLDYKQLHAHNLIPT